MARLLKMIVKFRINFFSKSPLETIVNTFIRGSVALFILISVLILPLYDRQRIKQIILNK